MLSAQNAPAARAAPGPAGERRELAVGDHLAPRHRPQRVGERPLERRRALEVDLDVGVVDRLAPEVRREPPAQIRDELGTIPRHLALVRFGVGARRPPWGSSVRRAALAVAGADRSVTLVVARASLPRSQTLAPRRRRATS